MRPGNKLLLVELSRSWVNGGGRVMTSNTSILTPDDFERNVELIIMVLWTLGIVWGFLHKEHAWTLFNIIKKVSSGLWFGWRYDLVDCLRSKNTIFACRHYRRSSSSGLYAHLTDKHNDFFMSSNFLSHCRCLSKDFTQGSQVAWQALFWVTSPERNWNVDLSVRRACTRAVKTWTIYS